MNIYKCLIITVSFIIFSILDKKVISKEAINVKQLTRNTLFVFISVLLGDYAILKLMPNIDTPVTQVFTSEPTF